MCAPPCGANMKSFFFDSFLPPALPCGGVMCMHAYVFACVWVSLCRGQMTSGVFFTCSPRDATNQLVYLLALGNPRLEVPSAGITDSLSGFYESSRGRLSDPHSKSLTY